jgi:ribose transport system substrate-binding protein
VDLIIEFQVEQSAAPEIGDKIAAAGIPLIAIDIPHPNAVYFGVDNYRVGISAGELLAKHARTVWSGKASWVLGLDLTEAGMLVQSRTTGAFDAIRAELPDLLIEKYVRMDGRGLRDHSRKLVIDFLRRHPKDHRFLIAAATDSSALGAVDAARELKREKDIAVVGHDCITEALEEMRRRSSPMIGTISHEIASYGPALIHLGMAMLRGNTVTPYNYVKHRSVTRTEVRTGITSDKEIHKEKSY